MYPEKIEYLKRAIKRTYKRYIGERTDGNATLLDVAKFFNIPIDESRKEDYSIKQIDYSTPSIEIKDEKNNATYLAEYTDYADLLNSNGGSVRFISLNMISPTKKIESLFYIGDEQSIITKMTFLNNGYSLIFEKEIPNNICLNESNKLTIQYKINNYRDSGVASDLLTKTIQTYANEGIAYTFEQTFTDDNMACLENCDSQNKYAYEDNGDITYGVKWVAQRKLDNNFTGVCFESTKIPHLESHFPYTISYEDYPRINDKNVISAIIFRGCIGKNNGAKFLQIYKTANNIFGIYSIRDYSHSISTDEEFQLSNLAKGKITSEEIRYLFLEYLRCRFGDGFIELISSDLLEFAKRIDIRNGIIEEDLDPLSPKLLFDKSFSEIASMIEKDKDGYFKLASEQFQAISHQEIKGQVKVLKAKNLQSSEN